MRRRRSMMLGLALWAATTLAATRSSAEAFDFPLSGLNGVYEAPGLEELSMELPLPPGQYHFDSAYVWMTMTAEPGSITCCYGGSIPCRTSASVAPLRIKIAGDDSCPSGWVLEPFLPDMMPDLYVIRYDNSTFGPCWNSFLDASQRPLDFSVTGGPLELILACQWTAPTKTTISDARIRLFGTRIVPTASETWGVVKQRY